MRFEQFDSGDAGPTASSANHASKFPYCGNYLKNFLDPQSMKKQAPKTWKAFLKWCGNEVWATEACTWGKGPLVQINSAKVGRAMGRTTNRDGGEVVCFIHGKVANKYEQGDGWIIWESTVLHELIHWARWKGKLSADLTDGNGDVIEVGKAFETEAYGADVTLQTPWRARP